VKFGLVGTGYWARVTHAAGIARGGETELAAVWGRSADKAESLAGEFGAPAYTDFESFLDQVEAVAFAVPPDIQAELATRAALAGKHLLLEKPVATSAEAAQRLAEAADRTGVCSVVFFAQRFTLPNREWLAAADLTGGWEGAWARWIVSAFGEGSPYASSPWRREKGALWDVGPHALSVLIGALGPVERVTADGGAGDLVHLIFHHRGGLTSTASLTLDAPRDAVNVEVALWGPGGVSAMPRGGGDVGDAFALALSELTGNIAAGQRSHPCDVHFGAAVTLILADAEEQIAARRLRLAGFLPQVDSRIGGEAVDGRQLIR
jgi:predicted dehydrogenase